MNQRWLLPVHPAGNKQGGWIAALRQKPLINRINTPAGYGTMLVLCLAIGYGVAVQGMKFGILVMIGAIALPLVYALVAYPLFGIVVFYCMAYLLMWVYRMGIDFPLGTLMDMMEVLFLLGLFINIKVKGGFERLKSPISSILLVWLIYNILQVGNPSAASRVAWVYTVRTVAVIMIIYFIFLYHITTKQFVRLMIKLWLGFAFFAATYCYKQEHFGFFPFEEAYLHSDPNIAELLFIGGTWRKFSIFSDPVVYSYTMAFSSLLCFGLMTGPFSRKKKIILLLLSFWYILNMLYSGTRGADVLIPAALIMFAVIKYNRKILIVAVVGIVGLLTLVYMPTSNYTIYRFQSAFKPNDDPSYKLRKFNQKRIQPFILSHPMGGGLGSVGEWGQRFSPGTFLANFAPDSGYIRVAVEMGWIGLIIILTAMFTILKTAINSYYSIRDPELKCYAFAFVLVIFAFHIANFPQEALVQYPSNVNFYLLAALVTIIKRIDDQQNKLIHGG